MKTGLHCEIKRESRWICDQSLATWRGRVAAYDNGRRIWTQLCEIERLTQGDALRDAEDMARGWVGEQAIEIDSQTIPVTP